MELERTFRQEGKPFERSLNLNASATAIKLVKFMAKMSEEINIKIKVFGLRARWLCTFLGFHKWSIWSEPAEVDFSFRQRRTCLCCNLIEESKVRLLSAESARETLSMLM